MPKPKANSSREHRFVFNRKKCEKCGRHFALKKLDVHYEINATLAHNKKVLDMLREQQRQLINKGLLDARDDVFSNLGEYKIKISELLPTQPALDHPDKFCYVANRAILNLPIIVARIRGKKSVDRDILPFVEKYVIIDGHTRAAVKLAEAKDPQEATINAIVIMFPNAESFYKVYNEFRKSYGGLSINDLIRSAKEQRVDEKNWKKHPEACPGIVRKPMKKTK